MAQRPTRLTASLPPPPSSRTVPPVCSEGICRRALRRSGREGASNRSWRISRFSDSWDRRVFVGGSIIRGEKRYQKGRKAAVDGLWVGRRGRRETETETETETERDSGVLIGRNSDSRLLPNFALTSCVGRNIRGLCRKSQSQRQTGDRDKTETGRQRRERDCLCNPSLKVACCCCGVGGWGGGMRRGGRGASVKCIRCA